jgi:hypothetical protein
MADRLDPLIEGGPAPTETAEDWEAVLAKAAEINPPLAPLLANYNYVRSEVLENPNGRTFCLTIHGRHGFSNSEAESLIRASAEQLFNKIIFGKDG